MRCEGGHFLKECRGGYFFALNPPGWSDWVFRVGKTLLDAEGVTRGRVSPSRPGRGGLDEARAPRPREAKFQDGCRGSLMAVLGQPGPF